MATASLTLPARSAAFDAALEGLTRLDQHLLEGGNFPQLYAAGVRYQKEPREMWRHVGDVYAEGWGDCEDLSAWRAAELRLSGEDPDASVGTYQSGPRRYHAIVVRGDGSVEDPSRVLGMKAPARPRQRRKEPTMTDDIGEDLWGIEGLEGCDGLADAVLGEDDEQEADDPDPGTEDDPDEETRAAAEAEPDVDVMPDPDPEQPPAVTYDAKPTARGGGGFRGVARVPFATGRALVTASSVKPTSQMAKRAALNLASRAMDSRAARALVPPQAQMALAVLRSPQARAAAKAGAAAAKKIGRFLRRKKRR